jgi:hypothetical protein
VLEAQIQAITTRRDKIAGAMIDMLENAPLKIDEGKAELLINQANDLLDSIP